MAEEIPLKKSAFERALRELSTRVKANRENPDSYKCEGSERCYGCTFTTDSVDCFNCTYCVACTECSECTHCVRCEGVHASSYCVDSRNCVNSSDRKSTRLNSSHVRISYAVFCLKKKN